MRKFVLMLALFVGSMGFIQPKIEAAVNFGDMRSVTLTTKAWESLAQNDIEAVLAYTNKCLELYGQEARKMQANMTDYAQGSNDQIFSYWALNDVATSLFIQAEAYRQANMKAEAKEVYSEIIKNYKFAQTWDPKGWFWKPAEAAKEKVAMLDSGVNLDFGDYTSSTLTTKAWQALANKDVDAVLAYTNKVIELYGTQAKEMQSSLTEYPWESKDKIFSYWALNDVGTSLYIKGKALAEAGKAKEAQEAFKDLIDNYSFAQCWDPQGWFWKPIDAAQQEISNLTAENMDDKSMIETTKSKI